MKYPLLSFLTALAFISFSARGEEPKPAEKPDQAALDKKFEQTMNNVTLVGTFTVKANKDTDKLHKERYVISSVKKVDGDSWLFMARIQYGNNDATIPLVLQVKWAGDTPVITLDKFKVPGFGTFSARIVIYDNQYAGMWDGGDHGGQMFGKIEKNEPAPTKAPEKKEESK